MYDLVKQFKRDLESEWDKQPIAYLECLLLRWGKRNIDEDLTLYNPPMEVSKQWLKDFIRHRKMSFIWKIIAQ